jgi:hypothetical protein
MNIDKDNTSELVLYRTEDGVTKIEVLLQDENVWMTQAEIQELYSKSKSTISEHISNIFAEGELSEEVVVRNSRTTTQHGAIEGKTQTNATKIYNLDMIIAVGLRVRSNRGTQFRQWAINVLHEYIQKGDMGSVERYKQGNHFDNIYSEELLEKALEEYSKFRAIQDKKYLGDFGKRLPEVADVKWGISND